MPVTARKVPVFNGYHWYVMRYQFDGSLAERQNATPIMRTTFRRKDGLMRGGCRAARLIL
jgi:hypothetical protein